MICMQLSHGFPCEVACLRASLINGDKGAFSLVSADIAGARSQPIHWSSACSLQDRIRPRKGLLYWALPFVPGFLGSQLPFPQPIKCSACSLPFCWDPPMALSWPFVFLVAPLSSESSTLGIHPEAELIELSMLIKWDFLIRHREGMWHARRLFSIQKVVTADGQRSPVRRAKAVEDYSLIWSL